MADEDVKETTAERSQTEAAAEEPEAKPAAAGKSKADPAAAQAPKTETPPAAPSTDEAAAPAKPAKKATKKKAVSKKVVAKKATRKKKTPAREAPVMAPPSVAAVEAAPAEKPVPASTPVVEPEWDDSDAKGLTTYLAEWGPVLLLLFLVLILDAPGGDRAAGGATGMRDAVPPAGDTGARVVNLEPARTPPLGGSVPDPAGGLGELPPLRGSLDLTRPSNPVDQEPGAYYWGPGAQSTETSQQAAGGGWPGDAPGAVYWAPAEGASTTGQ